MIPGETIYLAVRVTDSNGAAATGLSIGQFSNITTQGPNVVSMPFSSAVEVGTNGDYILTATAPVTPGQLCIRLFSSTRTMTPPMYVGEIESNDLDTIASAVIRPTVSVVDPASQFAVQNLVMTAYRYTPLAIVFSSTTDFSTWNNFRFNVWDARRTGSIYTLVVTTPAAPVNGNTTFNIVIPENAAFFSRIDTIVTAGQTQLALVYDLVGDEAATASKSRTVVAGALTLQANVGAA
jgi:hypothetical protein